MSERFSDRHSYRGTEQEVSVREDAPEGLRFAILLIADCPWFKVYEIAEALHATFAADFRTYYFSA